jgi:LmbE family N-acetylglucosaminyl deacetylase
VVNAIDQAGTDEAEWQAWTGLGQFPEAGLSRWARVLVVAAHPDDEVLGVGGTMARLAAAGAQLRLVSVTDGEASDPGHPDRSALAARRAGETAGALRALGAQATEVIRLGFPDTRVAAREDSLAARLRDLAADCDAVLAPWDEDVHADHEAVGRAARRASPLTYWYPVWTWHWARPGDPRVPWHRAVRVSLRPSIAARKRAAIRCFTSQLEPRGSGAGPVLTPATVAHFTRDHEVLLSASYHRGASR